jgi:hypothetical protein
MNYQPMQQRKLRNLKSKLTNYKEALYEQLINKKSTTSYTQ